MTYYAYRDVSKLGPYRVDPRDHYGLARELSQEFSCRHLERADIEQEAMAALCAAARTFDPTFGFRFSTWAGRLIRNHLSGVVHLYRRVGNLGNSKNRILPKALRVHLRDGGSTEASVVRTFLREDRNWGVASEWDCFAAASLYLYGEESLDDTWNHREGEDSPGAKIPRHETVEDPGLLQDIEDGVRAREIERAVSAVVGRLRPREREITVLRILPDLMGAGEDAPTLQDVADKWGVSRQRVQQVEADAMGKLRRMLSRA